MEIWKKMWVGVFYEHGVWIWIYDTTSPWIDWQRCAVKATFPVPVSSLAFRALAATSSQSVVARRVSSVLAGCVHTSMVRHTSARVKGFWTMRRRPAIWAAVYRQLAWSSTIASLIRVSTTPRASVSTQDIRVNVNQDGPVTLRLPSILPTGTD